MDNTNDCCACKRPRDPNDLFPLGDEWICSGCLSFIERLDERILLGADGPSPAGLQAFTSATQEKPWLQ